jgi:hypothetical protein
LVKRLRADASRHDLPIAVYSSDDVDPPSGIVDWLRKPGELQRLLDVVRVHCGE